MPIKQMGGIIMAQEEFENNSLSMVFEGTLWQSQLVQGQLEANGIASMLENDTLSAITSPYSNIGGNVKVLVNVEDKEKATEIISESEGLN